MKIIDLNLLIGEFIHESGASVMSPLFLPKAVRIGRSPQRVADLVATAMDKDLLQKGSYHPLLKYLITNSIERERITLTIPPSQKGLYPEMELGFDLFYVQNDKGEYIGFVPALALDQAASSLEELRSLSTENIRLEFIRKKRLPSVRSILATQWYKSINLHSSQVSLPFYTLTELENIQQQKDEKLLPQIARKMPFYKGKLYGLKNEFSQMVTALKGPSRTSILVIGGSGKGKTTLVRALNNQRSELDINQTIWEVSAAQLLHRLSGLGSWENYLGELCKELRKSGDILYISDFAELFEVGQYVGNSLSMAGFLRDFLARGEISIISECTQEQASQIDLRSPGYLGLFSTVTIPELTTPEIRHIITQKVSEIASQKSVNLEENAIVETLRLQQWYTPYSGLPGKTIRFLESLLSERSEFSRRTIDKDEIYNRFCQDTGMPEFIINPDSELDFDHMDGFFKQNIYGQAEAIQTVMDVLVSIKAAVIRRGKPLASLLFAGPTGVGKTEMAKVLAQYIFGDRGRMIRFDMSEYRDFHSIMRLTGDSTYGEGLLTSAVRQNPFSVVLFDELEKANPIFYDLLLQIIGEGRLTSARGRVADFCSTIIIMTSNIGARSFQTGSIGFVDPSDQQSAATEHFRAAVQAHFRPELFNRLDRIIAFAPLEQAIIRKIVDREVLLIKTREGVRGRNINLNIDRSVLDTMGDKGYNATYGARFLQRAIQEKLIIPLAKSLNAYDFRTPLDVSLTAPEGRITIDIEKSSKAGVLDQKIGKKGKKTLLSFVEEVTQYRRKVLSIKNGTLFARFLSEADRLERKLKKLKRKRKEHLFWQDEASSKLYFKLQEMEEKFDRASEEIQELELDNLLLINKLSADMKDQLEKFEAWSKAYDLLTTRLVKHSYPEYDTCVIGLYGPQDIIHNLADIYQALAEEKEFEVKPYTTWYHNLETTYLRKEHPPAKSSGPSRELLTFCGMEILIKGDLAFLYFKGEAGNIKWINSKGKAHVCVLTTAAKTFYDKEKNPYGYMTPEGAHRKDFFSGKTYQREYSPKKGMIDRLYNTRSIGNDYQKILSKALAKQFELNKDNILLY